MLTQAFSVDGAQSYTATVGAPFVAGSRRHRPARLIRVLGITFQACGHDRYECAQGHDARGAALEQHPSQTTVFIISNQSPATVAGSIFFYTSGGTLVHTEPLSVPLFGMQVLATSSIPALANLAGHATVAHDGGWNALAGKAVALEPASGFTFDTVMSTTSY